MSTIAVVGAGIAGLSAALRLAQSGHRVVLLEQSDRVGGKLRSAMVAGRRVDVGAESVLARRPEAVDLIDGLGLDKVHPARVSAQVWSRGALHPLPPRSLMGVPSDLGTLGDLLTGAEVARVRAERPVDVGDDTSVGDLVEGALGAAVVDRLVEPLLGGVYAGQARRLSARACVPALYDAGRRGDSLVRTAARLMPAPDPDATPAPVFASVRGGVGVLADALGERLRDLGVDLRTGTTVRALAPTGRGWRLSLGDHRAGQTLDADAVVLATPARATSKLLRDNDSHAADLLGRIEYASMAVVTYAFDRRTTPALTGSGFLVPPVDGRAIKAATFTSTKWPWIAQDAPDLVFARVSLGRHGEETALQRTDTELVDAGLADLSAALGRPLTAPVDAHVQRWGGGLPQYAVGHLELVAAVRDSLRASPTLAVAGAAYDGVGIPACIASGQTAADDLADHLDIPDQGRTA